MPRFLMELMDLKFDEKGYRKTVEEALQVQLRMAARAWLRAVIPHVPVYTGMARGSLTPIGKLLKVAVPIKPIAVRKGKNPDLGAKLGSFEFVKAKGVYSFIFTSDVEHYKYNEFEASSLPLRHTTPWESFKYGQAAFDKYVQTELPKKIPRVNDFIKAQSYIVR